MHASRTTPAPPRFRDQRSYRQLQNFVWPYSYSRDSRGPSCSLGQAQRPFPSSPLIPPTCLGAAGSRRSPCRPGLHLVDRVSRSRIRRGRVRNLDRRSNKKNREPDALPEDPVAIGKLRWQRSALFHAVLAPDRSCDMPSFRPWRGQRKRRRSLDRASLFVRKAARLSTKCRETCPFDWRNRAPERRADRRRDFGLADYRVVLFRSEKVLPVAPRQFFARDRFEWQTHRSNHGRNLLPKCARRYSR